MATELKKLNINRVDLVPEGANSAAFVTLFKGKEMNPVEFDELLEKMKPEFASIVSAKVSDLEKERDQALVEKAKAEEDKAKAEEDKAKAEEDKAKAEEDKTKAEQMLKETKREGTTSFDEDERINKSLEEADPVVKEYLDRIVKQKNAAEEAAKVALAKEKHNEAVSKAAELKALPIEEATLVDFIEKSADEQTIGILTSIAKSIETTVLAETGRGNEGSFSGSSSDAWSKIEKSAESIAKERGITVEAATAEVIADNPELYREYLAGGAN